MRSLAVVFVFGAIGLWGFPVRAADVSDLAGRWSGNCSYVTNMAEQWWELRTLYRIVRPLDADSLEVLEWVEAGNTPTHPKVDLVLNPPDRFIVTRKTGLTFQAAGQPKQVAFSLQQGKLVMQLTTEEEQGQTCFQKSLILKLDRDETFGRFRPSFDCRKATQAREKAICGSSQLSLLDHHLSLSFRAADYRLADLRQDSRRRLAGQNLYKDQEAWWATRLRVCQAEACVEPLLRERISYLDNLK